MPGAAAPVGAYSRRMAIALPPHPSRCPGLPHRRAHGKRPPLRAPYKRCRPIRRRLRRGRVAPRHARPRHALAFTNATLARNWRKRRSRAAAGKRSWGGGGKSSAIQARPPAIGWRHRSDVGTLGGRCLARLHELVGGEPGLYLVVVVIAADRRTQRRVRARGMPRASAHRAARRRAPRSVRKVGDAGCKGPHLPQREGGPQSLLDEDAHGAACAVGLERACERRVWVRRHVQDWAPVFGQRAAEVRARDLRVGLG